MGAAVDITGQKFGKLTAIEPTDDRSDKKIVWRFLCDCGSTANVTAKAVIAGKTKSCGCFQKEQMQLYLNSMRTDKSCPECGKGFTVKQSHASKSTYCSSACMQSAYKMRFLGAGNPNYKGGISQKESAKAWRDKNKEKIASYNNDRASVPGKHTAKDLVDLRVRQDGLCAACRCGLPDDFHVDHIIPVARGGNHFIGNIQLLCPKCNLVKKTMLPIEYRHFVLKGKTEDAEQSRLLGWALENVNKYPELALLMHIPNGGYRDKRTASKMLAMGLKKGVPDLNLPCARKGYHGLWIELKVGRNKPTTEQKAWLSALSDGGYQAHVCYGWEHAKDTIVEYLHS
jgi:5-methylcytosine-specific restriction endonuclease McrA